MKSTLIALALAPLFLNADGCPDDPPEETSFQVGLEAGAQLDTSAVDWVDSSGASWVRLNFIVASGWSGPEDPAFTSTYDAIVDGYASRGIQIEGLIGVESVAGGYDRNDPAAFVEPFTNTATAIIERYGDRVLVFELFNEPNDWAGGSSSQVTPYWFARFLESVYEQKFTRGWEVKLISGPLFSHDGDTGSQYLYDTYVAGMTQLSWDWLHENAGTYPLDGIGYHMYVQQGSTDSSQVRAGMEYNLSQLWQGVLDGENYRGLEPDPQKQIWITEIGWPEPAVGEDGQAQNVITAYDVLDDDPHVRLAMWFTLRDFDSNAWGLLNSDYSAKSSWYAFQEVAAGHVGE